MKKFKWSKKNDNTTYPQHIHATNTMVKDEIINNMYEDYTSGMAMSKVGEKYSKSAGSICNLFKRRGLKTRGSGTRKHAVDELFFQNIDTEEKAYILGFIFADGHVGEKSISIKVKAEDKDILEKISKALKSEYPITGEEYLTVRIYSPTMANSLHDLGLIVRKTWDMPKEVNVAESLMRHFMRGLIDGDGSVTIFYSSKEQKHKLSISLTGGDKDFIGLCDSIISNVIGCNLKKIMQTKGNWGKSYMIKWHDRQALLLNEWMYKESNIYLKRKYDNAKQFFGKKSNRLK